jgi:hypothetical protein
VLVEDSHESLLPAMSQIKSIFKQQDKNQDE